MKLFSKKPSLFLLNSNNNSIREIIMMRGSGNPWLIFGVIGVGLILSSAVYLANSLNPPPHPHPQRILVDTDVDTDDVFALFYLLKQDSSLFDLQGITINANGWSDAGHAVNHVYDVLHMMDRDDIAVGVGGDGGISPNSTFLPHLGGYLPLIDQGLSTAGECRYRQAIPVGERGRLYANTNFGLRKAFLPQVLHSGIPVTLVPLDATRTIPVDRNVFLALEQKQNTFEAQYCFQSLKMAHDTWPGDGFFEIYSMWDSFMVGVALSQMLNSDRQGGTNAFSKLEYLNITVVTSNEPYGISDGSNPLIDGRFGTRKNGVHNGHVQTGMQDPFCLVASGKGKCQDGYTKEVSGSESVQVLVAAEAKLTPGINNSLDKAFYITFLDVLNSLNRTGRFDIRAQFPNYKEVLYKPNHGNKLLGNPIVFDMDMSTGDFLSLFYLLKIPVEIINLKGIIVSPNGWATAATIDVVYDVLHMMGRDDIPVGLGDVYAIGEAYPLFPSIGDCKYSKAVPHGSGGFLDSDTLYGFARDLPRSPRRYKADNSEKFGATKDTDHPELRQMSALDVWKAVVQSLDPGMKITVLTNGPLTNLAQIIHSKAISSAIQEVYITGGHMNCGGIKGNIFTVPSNECAEFNFFLDPVAADLVLDSELNVTLIPLNIQRRVSSFHKILRKLKLKKKTPEALLLRRLLSRLYRLRLHHHQYRHVDMFLGEVLGAVTLTGKHMNLNQAFTSKPLKVVTNGAISKIGQTIMDEKKGKWVRVLESINPHEFYENLANVLGDERQAAVIGSFEEQKRLWSAQD